MAYISELKQTSVWYCHQQAWDPRRQDLPNQPLGFLLVLNRDVHVQTPHQVTQVDLNREETEYRTAADCAHGSLSCTETSCRKQYHSYKITAMRSGKMILYYHSSVLHSEQGKSYFIMNDGRVPTMAYRRPEKTHIFTWYGTARNTFFPPRYLHNHTRQKQSDQVDNKKTNGTTCRYDIRSDQVMHM